MTSAKKATAKKTTSATNKSPEYGIITFGSNHFGEISGSLGRSYMRIEGDWARVRSRIVDLANDAFAFQYESEEEAGVDRFGLTLVPEQGVYRK